MEPVSDNLFVVLLAGGTGTRLWPSSRKQTPKQFIKLFGTRTLFQETLRRVKDLVPLSRILVITNEDYIDEIQKQEPLIADENIIAEPVKRNTALAMGVASAYAHKRNPKAVVINLATDHLIADPARYITTLKAAAKFAAEHNCLVTVGIKPIFPHTGYGYIKAGEKQTDIGQNGQALPVYKVDSFKEKPDLPTAEEFLSEGNYFWNANNFVWPTQVILDEFKRLAPDISANIEAIYKDIGTPNEKTTLASEYEKARDEQIDIAIAEKTDKLMVIPGEFGWNDVGDWKVVFDLAPKDENGNHTETHSIQARHLELETKNTYIQAGDRLVVTVGVENLVIIDTPDAVLVCSQDKAQEVKKIVDELKEKGLKRYL